MIKVEDKESRVSLQVARIEAAYVNLERMNLIKNNSAYVVFASDSFIGDMEINVEDLPFSSKMAMVGRKILVDRKYKDFLFVGKCDFPGAYIWNIFEDFMVVKFSVLQNVDGLGFGHMMGVGSRGWDMIHVYAITEDSEYKDYHMESLKKYSHCCGGIVNSVGDLRDDFGMDVSLKLELGKVVVCNKCGYHIFVDFISDEKIVSMFKERIQTTSKQGVK